jgi:hypothetical protein
MVFEEMEVPCSDLEPDAERGPGPVKCKVITGEAVAEAAIPRRSS